MCPFFFFLRTEGCPAMSTTKWPVWILQSSQDITWLQGSGQRLTRCLHGEFFFFNFYTIFNFTTKFWLYHSLCCTMPAYLLRVTQRIHLLEFLKIWWVNRNHCWCLKSKRPLSGHSLLTSELGIVPDTLRGSHPPTNAGTETHSYRFQGDNPPSLSNFNLATGRRWIACSQSTL